MYAEIHSQSVLDEKSPGKTVFVNCRADLLAMKVLRTSPEHLAKPKWHIEISAKMDYEHSSGAYNPDSYRAVTRKLQLDLTPSDIARLISLVQAEGLVTFDVKDG